MDDLSRRVTLCCTECFAECDEYDRPTCDCADPSRPRRLAVAAVLGAFFLAVAFVSTAMVCGGLSR